MNGSLKKSEKRLILFNKYKKCHHCGKELVLNAEDPNQHNIATLENKYSYYDKERHVQSHSEIRWYLVCLECERKRDTKIANEIPKDILRDMCKRFPVWHEEWQPDKNFIEKMNRKLVEELGEIYPVTELIKRYVQAIWPISEP